MLRLFRDEGSDSDVEIKTNNDYADNYNVWRKKEEFNKLKTKYGDPVLTNDNIPDDESSSSDEDEDGRELTEDFEKDFFKTLSCLKNKDPKIYDEKIVFFDDKNYEENDKETKKKTRKSEPMFLKDYERKMILEKGAKFEDSDEEILDEDPRSKSPTYVEEQRKLKESLQQALQDEDEGNANWGGMFSKRQKTNEEHEKEEQDYKQWLKGNKDELKNKDEESALKPLKEYWNKPDLDGTEKFLRDYLLNKKYLENDDESHIPTYEEIVHDSDEGLSEDEVQIDKQEEFEHKYNFRYEEPDQEFIKRYPRTMEQSVRQTDDRRKVKRAEIKERKEEEKKQKQEDLKQLKILKRQEIEEKIKKLKEITGNEEMAFQEVDLDADFNPEEHDKRMQELFNDDYYQGEEGDKKPEFSDFEEELGPWASRNELHCEDEDFNMDCDYDPRSAKLEKNKKEKKKRKRASKTDKDDIEDLPIDENDEKYHKYMDELYKLDYEDMIGDIPCRFKYREVLPNDFGLSVEEILLAKDKELNRWCSLKKTMQYRPEHMEKYDILTYKRKSMNEDLKMKMLPSLYAQNLDDNEELENKVKAMIKRDDFRGGTEQFETNINQEDFAEEQEQITKKDKKNERKIIDKEIDDTKKNDSIVIEDTKTKSPKKKKKGKNINKQNKPTNEEKISNKIETNESSQTMSRRQKKNKKMLITKLTNKNESTETKTSKESRKRKLSIKDTENSNNSAEKKQKLDTKTENSSNKLKKKQKLNKKKQSDDKGKIAISKSRLAAYGINAKKFNNKLKYKNKK